MYRNRFSVWKKGRDRRKEDGNEREEKERAGGEEREKIAFFYFKPWKSHNINGKSRHFSATGELFVLMHTGNTRHLSPTCSSLYLYITEGVYLITCIHGHVNY